MSFRAIAAVALPCLLGTACASGAGNPSGAAPAAQPLPEVRGFAGGTQVQGGFTNRPSAVLDSVIAASPSVVWSALPAVFQTLEIETPTVERASYTMGNPGVRISRIGGSRQLSSYLDCGTGIRGANANVYEVTLQLLVQLSGPVPNETAVRTTLDAYARPRDSGGDPIHCTSEGTLEREILVLINRELAPDGPVGSGEALGPGGSGAPAATGPMSPGRLPVTGDLLRIECLSPVSATALVGHGRYAGAGNGAVFVAIDVRGRTIAVPATNIRSVQIRERRSYSVIAGIVGLVAGATAGGLYARSAYDPEGEIHYGPGFVTGIGVVVGGFGGGLLGRMLGSLVHSDTWHDAPTEWAVRTSGADGALDAAPDPTPCPAFEGS